MAFSNWSQVRRKEDYFPALPSILIIQSLMVTFVSLSQKYSNGFRIYNKEEKFLNSNEKKIFSENSLKNEESILWTKGEILGKGAYGTVS